jgi:hypothetical protein
MKQKDCGCPVIEAKDWEGRVFNWDGKAFYTEKVNYFFGVPLNVENRMARAAEAIEKKGYFLEDPLMVLVVEGTFSGAVYIAILPPEESVPAIRIFDNSLVESTVYQRGDSRVAPGVKEFRARLEEQGKLVRNVFLWHLGCPRCASADGYQTIIFAELAN